MKRMTALILALTLAGCQTCREHKADCAVAAGIGIAVAVISRSWHPAPQRFGDQPAICRAQSSACQ